MTRTKRQLALLGASGGTGRAVLAAARRRGHPIVALTRAARPDEDGARFVQGDARDPAAVARLVAGADAVISCLGPVRDSAPDLSSQTTAVLLAAMKDAGVRRLAVVTGAMIGHPVAHLGLLYRAIRRMFRRQQPAVAADRELQERLIQTSDLEWTILRPVRLTNGAPGRFALGDDLRIGALASTRRADLAEALLGAVEGDALVGRAVAIVSH